MRHLKSMWTHLFSPKYSENSLAEFIDENKHDTTFIASCQTSNNTWGDVIFSYVEAGRILFPRITAGLRLKAPLDILCLVPTSCSGRDRFLKVFPWRDLSIVNWFILRSVIALYLRCRLQSMLTCLVRRGTW